MLWILLAAVLAGVDQTIKHLIVNNIQYGSSIQIIKGFLYFANHQNPGAAWGVLQDGLPFLIIITFISIGVMIYFLFSFKDNLLRLALSLIMGGAAGNLIDRIFRGSVTDFIDLRFGPYIYPTFNIGDSLIVIGTGILAYYLVFVYEEA